MRTSSEAARRSKSSGGFTLAEVAVTIVIVGIALVLLLQGLGGSKAQAYYTRNLKLANQLARETLGEVASGLYRDEAEFGVSDTYADRGYPDFSFELYIGEDNFPLDRSNEDRGFNSWDHQRQREERQRDREERSGSSRPSSEQAEDEEDELREPFEKVRIVVVFPVIGSFENEYVATEWMPWEQVHGPKEEDESGGAGADSGSGPTGTGGGGGTRQGGGGVRQG